MNNQDILDKLHRAIAVIENYGVGVEDITISLSVTKETFSTLKDQLTEAEMLGKQGLQIRDPNNSRSVVKILYPAEPSDSTKLPTVEDYLKMHYGDNPPPKKKKRKK
jgi:hypothetical protein